MNFTEISYFYFNCTLHLNDPHTDPSLLAQLREGDKAAFEQIYRRYMRPLYQAAYKRLHDSDLAQDLVQDVFLRLWKRRAELRIDDLAAYLHTAIRYEILNHISRNKAKGAFYEPFEAMLADFDTPEQQLVAKQLMELIYAYADTLPEKRRQVFLLHIKNKLSVSEIAEKLNITPKTVHNHLGTAMNGLRPHIATAILLLWSQL